MGYYKRKEERASSPPMIFDLCEAKYDKINKIDSKMTHSKKCIFLQISSVNDDRKSKNFAKIKIKK